MSYVEKLLASSECVVRVYRDHWIILLNTILVDGAVSIVIVGLVVAAIAIFNTGLPTLGFLLLAIPAGHLLFRVWVWWNKQYVITNRRIIQITGMVQKRVSDTLLEKVNDIVTEQSAMGRLLKYGDVEIIAGSESGIDVFYRLADPVRFKKDLLDQKVVFGASEASGKPKEQVRSEGPDAPGAADVPELIEELDELREKGLLTDAEFEEKKRKLLDRI